MTVIEVEDIKKFMALLFKGDAFDRFLLMEAEIKMAVTFRIDGKINTSFLDTDEKVQDDNVGATGNARVPQAFVRWEAVKALCMDMIKGKRLPLKMRITMKKPVANEVDGQFSYGLNVMYEGGKLQLLTNVTAVNFSLERPDGDKWDTLIFNILKQNEIVNSVSTQ